MTQSTDKMALTRPPHSGAPLDNFSVSKLLEDIKAAWSSATENFIRTKTYMKNYIFPVTVTTQYKDGITSVGDNKGNLISYENGFVKVTCSDTPQDINLKKVAQTSAEAGAFFASLLGPSSISPHKSTEPKKKSLVPMGISSTDAGSLPFPSAKAGDSDFEKMLADIPKAIKGASFEVNLERGLPSPLTYACNEGKKAGMLRDQ